MSLKSKTIILTIISSITLGATCAPDVTPVITITPIPEIEPNNTISTAQPLTVSDESFRITGTLDPDEDVDLFSIGALSAGDQITVTASDGTDLSLSVVLFEVQSDGLLATLFAAGNFTPDNTMKRSPIIYQAITHPIDRAILGISRVFGSIDEGKNYDLTVSIQRGNTAPTPHLQTILIDFDGGITRAQTGQDISVSAFDAAVIDPFYAGQTQSIKNAIIETVRTNFAGFGIEVLDTDHNPPPTPPFSTIFIGTVDASSSALASEGFGLAINGIDPFNQNPDDDAIIFIQNFTPTAFGLSTPLDAISLGTTIGNVATHEAGHLLGLQHVFDPSDIMNTFDAPITLLLDQRFKRSLVHFSIFDTLEGTLTQDAPLLLTETVGRTQTNPDVTLATGTTPFAVTAADLDEDGNTDLAVANLDSDGITLFFNQDDQTFTTQNVNLAAGPIALATIRADTGGSFDLVTANPGAQDLSLLLNDSSGNFSSPSSLSAGDRPRFIAAADFNQDGSTDLAVTNYVSNDVSILLNDTHGHFALAANIPVGTSPQGIIAADLNGDGHPDLTVANFQSNDISILLNIGNGSFAPAVSSPVGILPLAVAAADLDGDGDTDLAVTNTLSSFTLVQFAGDISILLNNGDGTFTPTLPVFVGPAPESITVGDIDNDGDIDLVVANNGDSSVENDPGNISILLNNGDGTFAQDQLLTAGTGPAFVALAHLNGDARLDLIVVNRNSNNISIFYNHGGFK